MKVNYCRKWFRAKATPIDPIDEAEAAELHKQRGLYVAVVEESNAFIEINDDYLGVGFLDQKGREYLTYQFEEKQPGKVFLTMASHREFEGMSSTVIKGTTYFFNEEGRVSVENSDLVRGEKLTYEEVFDASRNWDAYPSFGDYTELLKIER